MSQQTFTVGDKISDYANNEVRVAPKGFSQELKFGVRVWSKSVARVGTVTHCIRRGDCLFAVTHDKREFVISTSSAEIANRGSVGTLYSNYKSSF